MNSHVGFEDVAKFVRMNFRNIIIKGGVSGVVAVMIFALYFAVAPRSEDYRAEVQVTLEAQGETQVYPNGDPFGFHDIISAPVMNRVWRKYEFDKKGVPFENFCEWFSIVAYDKRRAQIDAEYQGKMSKRNITVTELTDLQKEYEAKLAALASNRFMLTMRPVAQLDHDTAARLLADIPEIWFAEYATIKAPQIPSVVSADAIRAYVERSKASGGRALELIDAIRKYLAELKETCSFIRTGLMRGRNARISGEDLGTYESQLEMLAAEILRFKNRLLMNSSEADLGGYLAARIDDMECAKLELGEQVRAVQQTLDLIGEVKRGATEQKRGAASAADGSQLTLQADTGFFADFTAMVRRDANQALVQKYAQELTELRKKQAELAARKLYYDQIERYMKANAAKPASEKGDAFAMIEGFTQQLLKIGEKIVAFRDGCLLLYRTSDQFYVISKPAAYARSFKISLSRFALGLLVLWFLYNLVGVVKLWNRE